MKKLSTLTLILVAATIALASPLWAGGACVVAPTKFDNFTGVSSRTASWTSDASSGDVSGSTIGIVSDCDGALTGVVVRRDATDKPTDDYDFYLFDDDDIDVLEGDGVDMDGGTTAPTHVNKYLHPLDAKGGSIRFKGDKLRIAIINAGNSTKGTITFMFE